MSSAMVSLGIATGYERHYGVLKRLGSTPLSRAGLLTAKTLNVLVLEVVQAIAIIVTGIALGLEHRRRRASCSRSGSCSSGPSRSPGSAC